MNPYFSVEGVAGISFLVFCMSFVLLRMHYVREFQAIDFTIIAMGLVYGALFPVVVHGAPTNNFPGNQFIIASSNIIIAHTIAAYLCVIGTYIGWCAVPIKRRHRLGKFFSLVRPQRMVIWLYVMIAVAFMSQYLYTKDYGGFVGYFGYNRLVRSGLFDFFERSRFSFLFPFGGMSVIASFAFWGLIISKRSSFAIWIGFTLSLITSTYFLLASSGRVSIAIFFAILIMSIMFVRRTNYMIWYILFPSFVPVGIFLIFLTSNYLNLHAADNIRYFITKEASFIFVSFFAQLTEGSLFNVFYELVVSPAYLMPSSLTDSWLATASDINTEIIMGSRKGVDGVTGSIPTDIITFGLMQFHLIGVPIYAFIFGYFLRVASIISGSFPLRGLSAVFTAYVIMRIGVFGVFYSYPKHIMLSNFPALVVILVMVSFSIIKRMYLGNRTRQFIKIMS